MKKAYLYILSFSILLFSVTSTAYASNPTVIKAMVTGQNTILIVFSEPVRTTAGDYIGVGGAVMNKSPSSVSGSGTSNVTLTFDSVTFITGAKGSLSISSSLKGVKDNKQFIPTTVLVDDGQIPTVNSLSVSTSGTLTTRNSVISLVFSTNKNVLTPTVTIANSPVQISGQGSGPFSAQYTLTQDGASSMPITITLTDDAQNTSKITTGFSIGTLPVIASITSNAQGNGPLGVGESIIFTLTPVSASPGASIRATYNGDILSWKTDNGGRTYYALYTVRSDSVNQSFPLQLTDVRLTDQVGNMSGSANGTDVEKFVDTNYIAKKKEVVVLKEKVEPVVPVKKAVESVIIKGKFTKTLKKGSSGTEVKDLQKKLTSLALYKGPITGSFGSETESALKKFQAKNKLEQTGETGPLTRNVLNK